MPDLGRNAIVPEGPRPAASHRSSTGRPSPSWLYALTQGLHTNVGLIAIPFLLAKLWSVIPRLFAWPPVTSPAQAIERLSIALLVSSAVFELATGVLNAQYWYPFKFNFVVAHYYGAIVFVASLVLHVIVKLPVIARAYRERGVLKPLRDDLAHTQPEPPTSDGLVTPNPRRADDLAPRAVRLRRARARACCWSPTSGSRSAGRCASSRSSRRGGDRPRRLPGQQDRARGAGVTPDDDRRRLPAGAARRRREVALTREELLALPQRTATLPIACVEGWTTTQEWTGVPLALLAERAGAPGASEVLVESLQPKGVLRQAVADRRPDRRRRRAAGAEGQRRGPVDGPRLSRRGSSSPRCPACTTPSGWAR